MKIKKFSLHSYTIQLTQGGHRQGILVHIIDENGQSGWGDLAPLPNWSLETLVQAIDQLQKNKQDIIKIVWTDSNCLEQLKNLKLFPSVSFGLESALLSILSPLPAHTVPVSALLMGTPDEILKQAELRAAEGFTTAKVKVSNLSFEEAFRLINQLKDKLRLRIDVNRAWNTTDSLRFFSQFPEDAFDYVEEPFRDPADLHKFPGPLAVDESYPHDLTLRQLESLPRLKAVIYKPTMQGGMSGCLPLMHLSEKIVLSSSFESDLGLACVASLAHRLRLGPAPVGIGTFCFMLEGLLANPLHISKGQLHMASHWEPKKENINSLPSISSSFDGNSNFIYNTVRNG